jgi:hypothetical protein
LAFGVFTRFEIPVQSLVLSAGTSAEVAHEVAKLILVTCGDALATDGSLDLFVAPFVEWDSGGLAGEGVQRGHDHALDVFGAHVAPCWRGGLAKV